MRNTWEVISQSAMEDISEVIGVSEVDTDSDDSEPEPTLKAWRAKTMVETPPGLGDPWTESDSWSRESEKQADSSMDPVIGDFQTKYGSLVQDDDDNFIEQFNAKYNSPTHNGMDLDSDPGLMDDT